MTNERWLRYGLVAIAVSGLTVGLIAHIATLSTVAYWAWLSGTAPVVVGLGVQIARDFFAGRIGVDAVAFVSMSAALAFGQPLAGVVVAIMYSGGNVLEDFAVARAERDLRALVDRAPRIAHRRIGDAVEDVPIDAVEVGDALLVLAGEVVPVDGNVVSDNALIDESALTGEPLPVTRRSHEEIRSGTLNAGETFELRAIATAGESTYAGIIQLVAAAQTTKSPFIRLADRYAILLLPITLVIAGAAWILSNDPVRALAVLVASTPCPLILAAPVAFIAGVSQAARYGILVKGGAALESLARIRTVIFDKTGTLTIGGARLVAVETAPGEDPDAVLRLAGSLEQASHHVIAGAIVQAAAGRGIALTMPDDVRESLGSGLEGRIGNRKVVAGSRPLVFGSRQLPDWAVRTLRRASWRSALSVFVAVDGRPIGALLLADELRKDTPRAIQMLRRAKIGRIMMVTGDRADAAETIGAALDLDAVLADRSPADKVDAVVTEQQLAPTLMVGDGINDAPALAAAAVGIAMGARGASASSQAADVVILVDRLDRVSKALTIAQRAYVIALQSIVIGMALSGVAMLAAAAGLLVPVAGALVQEVIDVAVILNALRALGPGREGARRSTVTQPVARKLRADHELLERNLDRLQGIADALDDANPAQAVELITNANRIVIEQVVKHEREDEVSVYPHLAGFFHGDQGLSAMSRAHREIQHLGRLLGRLANGLKPQDIDRYLVRDAQRVIESIESLVRLHNAQEEDIYEHAIAA
jgi:heavy metal translocating P-type ATPase